MEKVVIVTTFFNCSRSMFVKIGWSNSLNYDKI